jgi:steroid delta-isomerase-like uncharacterized protein
MDTVQVVQTYTEAWSARDLDGYLAAYASDGMYRSPSVPKPTLVHSLKDHFAEFFAAFPDASCETVGLDAIADDFWVWRFVIRGTHTASFKGLAATGRKVETPGCEFIELRDNSVHSVVGYFDRLTMLNQLGLAASSSLSAHT